MIRQIVIKFVVYLETILHIMHITMHITQVMDGDTSARVSPCRISETGGRIALKFGVWLARRKTSS